MKCKIVNCQETTRCGQSNNKCWKVGFCPKHAVKFCPQIYKKNYDPERMPFRKRTRQRSPKIEKTIDRVSRQEKVSRILKETPKIYNEEIQVRK